MNDASKPAAARNGRYAYRSNLATGQENRVLRGVVAAMRRRVDKEEQTARERAGQLQILREANQHLVLATFSAADLHAAAELSNERQTVFLSMLAHELRDSIASIKFANTMMVGMDLHNAKLDKLTEIVGRQSSHLVRLVDDLLDVSRMRTGKLSMQLKEGSLAPVVHDAIATIQPALQLRAQFIRVELPADDVSLIADQGRLTQIFCNLLVNASKFSPPNTTIYVAAAVSGQFVSVTIRDEGKGIAPEDMARMFELFEQGPDEAGHHYTDGLGIGLSLVRSIATMHGGSVSVTSGGVGCGSEFTVLLPIAPEASTDPERR